MRRISLHLPRKTIRRHALMLRFIMSWKVLLLGRFILAFACAIRRELLRRYMMCILFRV